MRHCCHQDPEIPSEPEPSGTWEPSSHSLGDLRGLLPQLHGPGEALRLREAGQPQGLRAERREQLVQRPGSHRMLSPRHDSVILFRHHQNVLTLTCPESQHRNIPRARVRLTRHTEKAAFARGWRRPPSASPQLKNRGTGPGSAGREIRQGR